MKKILLLGIITASLIFASCDKAHNVTEEETTKEWEELSYSVLDKTFTDEELIGIYDTGGRMGGGVKSDGEIPEFYIRYVVFEWPSLYADKEISEITAKVYNSTGFFDDYKSEEQAYFKRHNYKTGDKTITGSDEKALKLVFMYDIPTSDYSWDGYAQSRSEEMEYLNDCINKAVIQMDVKYKEGSTDTDYYRIELVNKYGPDRVNVYKLAEN